jgi:hypothetical protein
MYKYFEELEEVYKDRHQYSMEWAYNQAQDKLDEMLGMVADDRFLAISEKTKRAHRRELNKGKWYTRIFKNTYNLVTIFEFIMSVLLVLFVSELSHQGEAFLSTRMFSFSVVIVFAFIKVFIEHFLLRPTIEKLGWHMYNKTIKNLKTISTSLQGEVFYE